jgi:hypothetical protein
VIPGSSIDLKNGLRIISEAMSSSIPVYEVTLPEYNFNNGEPDHKAISKPVDEELRKHFMGKKILIRGLGSHEHDGKSVDELIEIIKTTGTDRYDPKRIGDRYTNVGDKYFDLCALRRTISERSRIFWQLSWSFYASPLKERGYPVRVDILTIYDPKKLRAVTYSPIGQSDRVMRDGFVFKDPSKKADAILGIIKIT